jgi:hypothetical protein
MCGALGSEADAVVGAAWKHPLVKKGKLDSPLIYDTWEDQRFTGDLQLAEYEGTPAALFQEFFAGATVEASSADAINSAGRGGIDAAVAWLEKESQRMIRACRREMNDGTAAFPPQVGIGYEAFWLRDYAYMIVSFR